MSMNSTSNPINAGFAGGYSAGPPSQFPTDPDERVALGRLDSRARNALILGIASLVLSVLAGIPAIVVGRRALVHIKDADGEIPGRWAAWTGLALGVLSVVVLVAGWTYLHLQG
jgi:hypothetical protein